MTIISHSFFFQKFGLVSPLLDRTFDMFRGGQNGQKRIFHHYNRGKKKKDHWGVKMVKQEFFTTMTEAKKAKIGHTID